MKTPLHRYEIGQPLSVRKIKKRKKCLNRCKLISHRLHMHNRKPCLQNAKVPIPLPNFRCSAEPSQNAGYSPSRSARVRIRFCFWLGYKGRTPPHRFCCTAFFRDFAPLIMRTKAFAMCKSAVLCKCEKSPLCRAQTQMRLKFAGTAR